MVPTHLTTLGYGMGVYDGTNGGTTVNFLSSTGKNLGVSFSGGGSYNFQSVEAPVSFLSSSLQSYVYLSDNSNSVRGNIVPRYFTMIVSSLWTKTQKCILVITAIMPQKATSSPALITGIFALVVVSVVVVTMVEIYPRGIFQRLHICRAIAIGYDIFWLYIGASCLLSSTEVRATKTNKLDI